MADYRIYFLDDVGHIALADWFAADSDEEAISTVRRHAHNHHHRCEIWQEKRLVATLAQGGIA